MAVICVTEKHSPNGGSKWDGNNNSSPARKRWVKVGFYRFPSSFRGGTPRLLSSRPKIVPPLKGLTYHKRPRTQRFRVWLELLRPDIAKPIIMEQTRRPQPLKGRRADPSGLKPLGMTKVEVSHRHPSATLRAGLEVVP
jgi:hypothetical protein